MAQPSMLRHECYALEVEKAKTPGWRRRKELDLKSARIDVSFHSITLFFSVSPVSSSIETRQAREKPVLSIKEKEKPSTAV